MEEFLFFKTNGVLYEMLSYSHLVIDKRLVEESLGWFCKSEYLESELEMSDECEEGGLEAVSFLSGNTGFASGEVTVGHAEAVATAAKDVLTRGGMEFLANRGFAKTTAVGALEVLMLMHRSLMEAASRKDKTANLLSFSLS